MNHLSLLFFGLIAMPAFAAQGGIVTILTDWHTSAFIAINLALTAWFYRKFDRFAVVHGPEVLTTVGIFGCFFGIATALLDFDAQNVSTSVPQLLEGVKTAFWASVSGVGGSLILRFKHRFHKEPIKISEGHSKAASLDDVVDGLRSLQSSLSGAEEGSLLTQLKLMRQEQNDQLGKLRSSFDDFASRMQKDGTDALVNALREVIEDFNAKISDHLGDNFKQLNSAIGQLVEWQNNYKNELSTLQESHSLAANDFRRSAESLSLVADNASHFEEVAKNLGGLLSVMDKQYGLILESQKSLSTVLSSMKDTAPDFSDKLSKIGDSIVKSISILNNKTSDLLEEFGVQVKTSNSEMKQLVVDALRESQSKVSDELAISLEIIKKGVIDLDKGLEQELTKSLETLGRQLASLSEKFVSDYTPLTEKLRELISLSSKAQRHE